MPTLSIALVGGEEEIKTPEQVLRALGKKTPLKLVTAKEAVAAVSTIGSLLDQTGKVHAIFAHNRFTAAGKEPYIEVFHKALKKKFQGIPVYAFGKESKAGTKGKSYTDFVDFDDSQSVGAVFAKLGGGGGGGEGSTSKSGRSNSGSPRRPKSATPKSPSAKKPHGGAFPMSPPAMGGPPSPFQMNNSGRFGFGSGPLSPTMGGAMSPNSFGPPSPVAHHPSGFAPIPMGTFQANQPLLHQGVQTSFGMGEHIATQTSLLPQMSGMTPGAMTPNGTLTPNGYSHGQQLVTNGSPNAELIKHLSMELDRLKSLVLEKRAQSNHSADMLGQSPSPTV